MKVLNLDKLSTKGQRQLRLSGVDHAVLPMTVGNYVETTLAAERMVDAGDPLTVTALELGRAAADELRADGRLPEAGRRP